MSKIITSKKKGGEVLDRGCTLRSTPAGQMLVQGKGQVVNRQNEPTKPSRVTIDPLAEFAGTESGETWDEYRAQIRKIRG